MAFSRKFLQGTVNPFCGNFSIFLSVRIYVKSILHYVKVLKMPFLAVFGALKFGKYQPPKRGQKLTKSQDAKPLNVLK